MPDALRQRAEEMAQPFEIERPARRQLVQHGPKRRAQRRGVLEETLKGLLGILQLLHVREEPARLDREQEAGRGALAPAAERVRLGQPVEAVVDLDGVERRGVAREPLARAQVGGVEVPLPMLVLPAGTADSNHGPARKAVNSASTARASPCGVHTAVKRRARRADTLHARGVPSRGRVQLMSEDPERQRFTGVRCARYTASGLQRSAATHHQYLSLRRAVLGTGVAGRALPGAAGDACGGMRPNHRSPGCFQAARHPVRPSSSPPGASPSR